MRLKSGRRKTRARGCHLQLTDSFPTKSSAILFRLFGETVVLQTRWRRRGCHVLKKCGAIRPFYWTIFAPLHPK